MDRPLRCDYGGGVTGSRDGRCREKAAPESVFCEPHRSLSLSRLRQQSDEVALRQSLRWPMPKRFKVRQVL